MPNSVITQSDIERAVLTMAAVAFENEKYFGDLDGEMGDADFGKSLAQGFRAIQAEFDKIDHSDIGTVLLKCGMIFAANVGGCSGPLWGTAFMRAGMSSKGKTSLTLVDLVGMGKKRSYRNDGARRSLRRQQNAARCRDSCYRQDRRVFEKQSRRHSRCTAGCRGSGECSHRGNPRLGGQTRPGFVRRRPNHRNSRSGSCRCGHDGCRDCEAEICGNSGQRTCVNRPSSMSGLTVAKLQQGRGKRHEQIHE